VTPRVPEEGKLRALTAAAPDLSGEGTDTPPGAGPEPPRVRRRRHARESSAERLAHPPHSMRVVEACSDAAERGAAFVRPHCTPHITEEHSAAAGAAPAQSTPCRIK